MVKRRPKDIGTDAERAVVRYLRANGFPRAERRALHGAIDLGDITGTPGLCWEVKGGQRAKAAGDGQVWDWLRETSVEVVNADAEHGILVVRRDRKSVGDWWAVMWSTDLAGLLGATDVPCDAVPVRMALRHAVSTLRECGWGDPGGQADD